MPYKLRKAPNRDLYWVVTIETGKKHSRDPIPIEKAKAQMRILSQALIGGADDDVDEELARIFGQAAIDDPAPRPAAPAPRPVRAPRPAMFEERPFAMVPRPPRRQGTKRKLDRMLSGRGNPELEAITTTHAELERFPGQRKSRLEESVAEGTRELDARAGFTLRPEDVHTDATNSDGTRYQIEVKRSPTYPNVRLITYTLIERAKRRLPSEIGHRIVLTLRPGGKYEYYNSNGQIFADLPKSVKDIANVYGGMLINWKSESHQGAAPICERHSISRACFAGTNAEYNAFLTAEAARAGKTFDEYIWEKNKTELLRGRGKCCCCKPKKGGVLSHERVLQLAREAERMRAAIRDKVDRQVRNPLYRQVENPVYNAVRSLPRVPAPGSAKSAGLAGAVYSSCSVLGSCFGMGRKRCTCSV